MLDNKKQHNYILNMLEMTGQLAERKVENGNGIYNQVQVFETQLGLNLVVSNCMLRLGYNLTCKIKKVMLGICSKLQVVRARLELPRAIIFGVMLVIICQLIGLMKAKNQNIALYGIRHYIKQGVTTRLFFMQHTLKSYLVGIWVN